MLQDIGAEKYKVEYKKRAPRKEDFVVHFCDSEVIYFDMEEFVKVSHISIEEWEAVLRFLFHVEERAVFLYVESEKILGVEEKYSDLRSLRTMEPDCRRFAGITALHLHQWYMDNRHCGRCGTRMEHKEDERALVCAECGFITYPKICPAIIVGIVNDEKLLLTKYTGRAYARYALVAGFCEIGETLEDCVKREVREEVGIEIKELVYVASQPWGFSSSLLMGFFAKLDGGEELVLDQEELAEAVWVQRDELPLDEENELSLTYTMIKKFREGEKIWEV